MGENHDFHWKVLQEKLDILNEKYTKLLNDYAYLQASAGTQQGKENEYVKALVTSIQGLLESENLADIVFIVAGKELPAHRLVISARCKVLNELVGQAIASQPKSGDHKVRVKIPDRFSISTFRSVLSFIYKDYTDVSKYNAFELLSAAAYFQLPSLLSVCERVAISSVTIINCVDVLRLSLEANCKELTEHCMVVIGSDFEGVCRKSDDFEGTSAEIVAEIYKRHCRYPLHYAIEKGRSDIIFNLLVSIPPIDPNGRDGRERLPLRIALQQKDGTKIAEMLLDHGADIDAIVDSDQNTFLLRAIEEKDIPTIEFLLSPSRKKKVNLNSVNMEGQTPLHRTIALGLIGVFKEILARGADTNIRDKEGLTPLMLAAGGGQLGEDIVKMLVKAGASTKVVDNAKNTALHLACDSGYLPTIIYLINDGLSSVNAVNTRGKLALHLLTEKCRDKSIAAPFVQAGVNLDTQDAEGNTPLHRATAVGNWSIAQELVRYGASVSIPNLAGRSPIDYPAEPVVSVSVSEWASAVKSLLALIPKEPVWLPDESALRCQLCKKSFSVSRRRHHCRHCGRVICDKCSPKKINIRKFNLNQPERVCTTCFEALQ